MHKRLGLTALAALALMAATAAQADTQPGFYAGAGIGSTKVGDDDLSGVDDSDTGHADRCIFVHVFRELCELSIAGEADVLTGVEIAGVTRSHLLHGALDRRIDGQVHVVADIHLALAPFELIRPMRLRDRNG